MDVDTLLRDREKLWGTRIDLHGQLRGDIKISAKPVYELAWVVQDEDAKRAFDEAVLILKPDFLYGIRNHLSKWIGPFFINEPISISGTLSRSSDDRFPVALTNITTLRLEDPKKGKEFDFSAEGET
jgi:hypothetical protein